MTVQYKHIKVSKIIRNNGDIMQPSKEGIYSPETEEDIALCKYFTKVGVLEKITPIPAPGDRKY